MKFTSVLGLLGLSALSQAGRTKRDYVNNDYYVLHLDDSIAPQDVGQRLGLEHQGELEGLTDHHIFSAPKSAEDVVVPELKERKRRRRDVGGNDILDGVLLAKKQEPHRRLSKRIIPPRPADLPLEPRLPQSPVVAAVEKQTKIMRDLDISDPIFKNQWHLFNSARFCVKFLL
jgi:kexin